MGRRKRQAKSAPREPHMPGPEGEVVDPWWLPIPIVLAVLAVYANSLSGAFLLDDQIMLHRPWVQSLAQWQTLLAHSPRPVVDFTFAVNHALGGTGTVGYHMINVAVHLAAALTLFGLVRRTLGTAGLRERFCGSAGWIAWSVALIWAVHPVNTQAVTYIVQRAESMMGLFYLLMLYALLRGATATSGRVLWYLAAIAASWLGMGSKGVMVTAPFVALMYDRAFLSTSMRAVLVARGWVHGLIWVSLLGLYLTGVAPSVLKTEASARASVGFAYQEVTPMAYALTQPGVLLHYVKLSLLPIGQCLDYDWPIAKGLGSSWPSLLTVGVFVAATVLAWRRRPALGFVGLWFFVILAPTSSFIPIKDAAFEHRMYLPLVAIVTIVVLLGHALIRRVPLGGPSPGAVWARYGSVFAAVVAVLLCGVSMARNTVYANRVTIWTDVVHKRPDNNRARSNLGLAYMEERKFAKAESVFREGIRRDPQHTNYYLNLSKVLSILGRYEDAQDALKEAARIEPERAETQYNLGVVLTRLSGQHADAPQALEQLEQAAEAFRAALRLKPQLDPARTNLQKATRDLIKAPLAGRSHRRCPCRVPRVAAGAWR